MRHLRQILLYFMYFYYFILYCYTLCTFIILFCTVKLYIPLFLFILSLEVYKKLYMCLVERVDSCH